MYSYSTTLGYTFEVLLLVIIDIYIMITMFRIPNLQKKERWIITLCMAGAIATSMDLLCTTDLIHLGNLAFLIANQVCYETMILMSLFLLRLTEYNYNQKLTLYYIAAVPVAVTVLINASSYWTHWFIYMDDEGVFRHGVMFDPVVNVMLGILGLILVLSIVRIVMPKNRKHWKILMESIEYPAIILITSMLTLSIPDQPFTSLGITMMLVFVYVNNQAGLYNAAVKELNVRMDMLHSQGRTDELTGLGNRRAMYEYTGKKHVEKKFAVVYCDITGLKTINDTLGHRAGDQLITRAVKGMTTAFQNLPIFRVGGDEFVIFCPNFDEAKLKEHIENAQTYWTKEKINVAIGYGISNTFSKEEVDHLITEAEQMMYAEKSKWYQKNGVERRRSS